MSTGKGQEQLLQGTQAMCTKNKDGKALHQLPKCLGNTSRTRSMCDGNHALWSSPVGLHLRVADKDEEQCHKQPARKQHQRLAPAGFSAIVRHQQPCTVQQHAPVHAA